MTVESKQKKADPYAPYAVKAFLLENFRDNPVMWARLTNLIDGIREAEFERGRTSGIKEAKRNMKERAKLETI